MTGDYKTYLAQQVLSEGVVARLPLTPYVTSEQENSKKPGSIHAVYLVCGFVSAAPSAPSTQLEHKDGEDVSMQSSPFMSSSMPQKEEDDEFSTAKTVVLCREEDLEGAWTVLLHLLRADRAGLSRLTFRCLYRG
ncbi:MAG: hypothetical protein Q9194_001391 [Teloschistes cf. exilis]